MDGWNVNLDFSLAVQAPPGDDITENWEQYKLFFEMGSICQSWPHWILKKLPHTFDKYRLSNLYFEFLLFFKVGKFCFLGHLKVVSKLSFELRHPLYMICSIFRSKFDHSWQIKKKKHNSKLSSEIQSRKQSMSKAW